MAVANEEQGATLGDDGIRRRAADHAGGLGKIRSTGQQGEGNHSTLQEIGHVAGALDPRAWEAGLEIGEDDVGEKIKEVVAPAAGFELPALRRVEVKAGDAQMGAEVVME